ncbi:MAG: amidohydrolase, partial [Gemmatimonadaceae bacterium]
AARADLVLVNGTVVTLDSLRPTAQAIAIAGGRVTATGTTRDIRALAGPRTRVIDLRGRTAVPGFADGHLHDAGGGPGLDLSATRSIDELLGVIASASRQAKRGEVLYTNSDWHEAQLAEHRLPLRAELDRAAPTVPVVVVRGGHEMLLNSAALTRFHIMKETPVPAGGRISRDASGELTGELVDRAMDLVDRPPETPLSAETVRAQLARLNAAGLTSIRIPGGTADEYRILREMHDRRQLTMRVSYLFRLTDASSPDAVRAQVRSWGVAPVEGDEWLRVGGVKLGVDGGFEGGWMRTPYEEPMGRGGTYRGLQTMSEPDFLTATRTLNSLGWRVATHAVGDAAIDLVLRGYAAANAEHPIAGKRWAVEHAFIARPEHLHAMKELGLVVSAQNHLWLAGPVLVKYWGAERAALTTPMRSFVDSGLVVGTGTDSPVVPYPPLKTFYHFTTRRTISGGTLGADQAVSRLTALRAATWGNAYLTGEEASKGTLAVGQLADLAVLSDNIMTCSDDALDRVQVELTIVGGRVVWQRR